MRLRCHVDNVSQNQLHTCSQSASSQNAHPLPVRARFAGGASALERDGTPEPPVKQSVVMPVNVLSDVLVKPKAAIMPKRP